MRPRSLFFVLPTFAMLSTSAHAYDAATVYAKAKGAVVTIRTDTGSGTGFVVGDGTLVLTCWHVVNDAVTLKVDETGSRPVTIVGHNAADDVALLRLSKPIKRTLALKLGAMPEPGTKVYAIGTSLGFLDHTLSEGIVSGRRQVKGIPYIQITAPTSEGNSGGPVLDDQARVVGMTSFGYEEGQSLNFALASSHLASSLSSIRANERVTRVAAKQAKRAEVLGRLGQVKESTAFYQSPNRGSDKLGRIEAGRFLVVKPSVSQGWLSIVLENRKLAYVPAETIQVQGFEVTDHRREQRERAGAATLAQKGVSIATAAMGAEGSPYAERGSSLSKGVGNGEFVALLFAAEGYDLPASPESQAKRGAPVPRYEDLQAGDRLYFWDKKQDRIGQTAIYLGGGYFTMADPKTGKVTRAYLDESRQKLTVAARRGAPLKNASGLPSTGN